MQALIIFIYVALISAIALVIVKFTFAFTLFKKYRENREHKFLVPVAFLFLTFAIARCLLIYFDFYLTRFDDDLFQQFNQIWRIAMTIQNVGFVFIIYVAEREIFVNKTKNIITILSIAIIVVISFIPDIQTFQTFLTISLIFMTLIIPISYIYLVIKTTGQPRLKALSIVIGFFLYMASMLIVSEMVLDGGVALFLIDKFTFRYIMYSISMLTRIAGLFFVRYGYLKE